MKFSEKLQKLRKDKKLSQEQLAEMLEVSRQSVSKWESGQTYPEMDKLIQLCRIFDCTLDDMTNDEVSDVSIQEKHKNQINTIIDEMLNAIDKTYTLFTHMNGSQIGKCLGELVILAIILFIGGIPLQSLGSSISSMFYTSNTIVVGEFINIIINLIHFSLALIIFFYLYDRQYLSKVDEYVDNYEKEKQLEYKVIDEEISGNTESEQTEEQEVIHTNIQEENEDEAKKGFFSRGIHSKKSKAEKERKKRDFSGFKVFIKMCSSFCMILIKSMVSLMTVPFLLSIVLLSTCLILAIYLGIRGVLLFSIILGILVLMILNYELLEVVYCFILNKIYAWKRLFYMFIIALILGGISIGWCIIDIAQFSFVSGLSPNARVAMDTYEYTMTDEFILITNSEHSPNKTIYVSDEKMGDKVRIEVSYMEDFDKIEPIHHDDFVSLHHTGVKEMSFPRIIDMIISDMQDKTLYIYDSYYNTSVRVIASQENLVKLNENYQKFIDEQTAYNKDMMNHQNELVQLREEYENRIEEYEQKINELNSIIENRVDDETYQLIVDENEFLKQQISDYEYRLNQLSELINQ